ncbi:MAG: ABC transporter permease [Oscillospiraceae bacterium]|nr:ABC transporter permease [Oscillospiraceae bacterium]
MSLDEKCDNLDGFASIDEAMKPASFREEKETGENQLFLTPRQMVVRRFFRNRLAVVGVITLVVMALSCYIVPLFYAYSETELFYLDKVTGEEIRTHESEERMTNAILGILQPPSPSHILGTNGMGQDMLARLMYGGRISLMVGFIVVFIELLLGVIIGGVAGYYGRWVDGILMRVVEIVSSIPFLPLMLIIASLMISLKISPSVKIYYTMFILGFLYWTGVARLVRGNILSLREAEFMQAADATGIKPRHKITRHLIPNILPNLIVAATLDLGSIILLESTMSFLGVGVGAPYASWGNMVTSVADSIIMRMYPNIWVAPGLCILITVMAFNFVGDGLRDATDPKMKGR